MNYTLRQENGLVPAWDIFYGDEIVGLLTDFPLDGPTATVKCRGKQKTVEHKDLQSAMILACQAHEDLMESFIKDNISDLKHYIKYGIFHQG